MSHSSGSVPIKFGVGQPVRRFEDVRLVTGQGRYQDDITLPRQAYSVFLRSPHAHARIRSIDTNAAAAAPGVLAVYTGQEYAAAGLGMPKAAMPRKKADGSPMFAPQRPALVVDRVRYVGDPVAMVIAESLMQAKDAAELISVDYDALPAGVRERADKQFALMKANPKHPSLRFKKIGDREAHEVWSARITLKYRALAIKLPDEFLWFWIGEHDAYDEIIG